jgi:MFS transporter, ACS family, hexuronate transporter
MTDSTKEKIGKYRWVICTMLFFGVTINYMDRQVLSLTWRDFIAPEFHWTNTDYGNITAYFSIFYAISLLIAGRFIDWMDTKKGFLWAIGVWSVGACLHAFCGIGTSGILTGQWFVGFAGARDAIRTVGDIGMVASTSVTFFVFARFVLALGEAGNFPASIKATAEYFPKKDRAYATSIFNSGANVGAIIAPLAIPTIAASFGWEMSFIIIGVVGFVWMFFWQFLYKKPEMNPSVKKAELEYILQDKDQPLADASGQPAKKLSFTQCFKYKQTWAFAFGKFMTDGVWWFYLFWTPAYLSSVYGLTSDNPTAKLLLFVLYAITMLSIVGGWLPTYYVDKKGMNPYEGRMRAMLIFAFFPLFALLAQPLGEYSYWFPIIIIGIAGTAHQAWSANIFTTVSDMFPKSAVATITGIGGMAGGVGSYLINKGSGVLFDYADMTKMKLLGFEGIRSGYFIIFTICAVAYLIGWVVMKSLVPKYKPVVE